MKLQTEAEAEVFASVWGPAPYAAVPPPDEPEIVFASSWDPAPVVASASIAASEPETPPWEAEAVPAPDAIELDALWDSFDTEVDHWLREGLCPHCQEMLPNLLGTTRVSCDVCGSEFVTPSHLAVLELAQD
ncbi:MAG: hypothetical protein HYY84_09080 [Deltaproteobacteria bacterium]|nr:hypothetical protein [Deltaproteobacteria bacterium]